MRGWSPDLEPGLARRLVVSVVAAFLLSSCGSTVPSPGVTSPAVRNIPPAAAPSTPASAIPALSPGPTAVATATATPEPSPSPPTAASGLPVGWQHELICEESAATSCQLHLRDAAGRDQPGWPVTLAGGCWLRNLAVGTDGIAYIACQIDDQQVLVSAVDVSGASVPGWPIRTTGYPLRVELGRDGSVYLGTVNEAGNGVLSIHAFGPDGHPRAGWPALLPRTADFAIAPDGTIVAWWYEDVRPNTLDIQAARTKFTMIGPNGRTLAGWPVTSIGTATVPVITKDDSLFYTSATGKVWGHDRRGNIIDGWPYQLPRREAPELRPDGRLMFILDSWGADDVIGSRSEVIVLTAAGQMASGWPYRTDSSLAGPLCCTDCGLYFPHAVSADGTLYLAPWTDDRAEVVALDRRGRVVTGWPYRLPAGSAVAQLELGSAGRLVVTLRGRSAQESYSQDRYCDPDTTSRITLTPAGEFAP